MSSCESNLSLGGDLSLKIPIFNASSNSPSLRLAYDESLGGVAPNGTAEVNPNDKRPNFDTPGCKDGFKAKLPTPGGISNSKLSEVVGENKNITSPKGSSQNNQSLVTLSFNNQGAKSNLFSNNNTSDANHSGNNNTNVHTPANNGVHNVNLKIPSFPASKSNHAPPGTSPPGVSPASNASKSLVNHGKVTTPRETSLANKFLHSDNLNDNKDGLSISIPQFICSEAIPLPSMSQYSTLLMASSSSLTPLSPNGMPTVRDPGPGPQTSPMLSKTPATNGKDKDMVRLHFGMNLLNGQLLSKSLPSPGVSPTQGVVSPESQLSPLKSRNKSPKFSISPKRSTVSPRISTVSPTKLKRLSPSPSKSILSSKNNLSPSKLQLSPSNLISSKSVSKVGLSLSTPKSSTLSPSHSSRLSPGSPSYLSKHSVSSLVSPQIESPSHGLPKEKQANASRNGALVTPREEENRVENYSQNCTSLLLKPVDYKIDSGSSQKSCPEDGSLEEDKNEWGFLFLSEMGGSQCSRTVPGLMRFYSRHKKSLSTSLSVSLSLSGQGTPPCSPISPGSVVVPPQRSSLEASTMTSPADRGLFTPGSSTRGRSLSGSSSCGSRSEFGSGLKRPSPSPLAASPSRIQKNHSSGAESDSRIKDSKNLHNSSLVSADASNNSLRSFSSPWPLGHSSLSPHQPYWFHSSQFAGVGASPSLNLGYEMARDPISGQLFYLPRPHPLTDAAAAQRLLWAGYGGVPPTPVVLTPEQLLLESHLRSSLHHTPSPLLHLQASHHSPFHLDKESPKKDLTQSDLSMSGVPPAHFICPPTSLPYYFPPTAPHPNHFSLSAYPQSSSTPLGVNANLQSFVSHSTSSNSVTTTTVSNAKSHTVTSPSKPENKVSNFSMTSNVWSSSCPSRPLSSPGLQKNRNTKEPDAIEPPIDLTQKSNLTKSGDSSSSKLNDIVSKLNKKNASKTAEQESFTVKSGPVHIKKEIKIEPSSPIHSYTIDYTNKQLEQTDRDESLKMSISKELEVNQTVARADCNPTIELAVPIKDEVTDNLHKDLESEKQSNSNQSLNVFDRLDPAPCTVQRSQSIDSSGLELLLQTFLEHGDRLAPDSDMPCLEKATEPRPPVARGRSLSDTHPPVLIPYATCDTTSRSWHSPNIQPSPLVSESSCLPNYPPKQSGLSVLCALAEQRILEEEEHSALTSLADLASKSPSVPTNTSRLKREPTCEQEDPTSLNDTSVSHVLNKTDQTDVNCNYKSLQIESQNDHESSPSSRRRSSASFVGFEHNSEEQNSDFDSVSEDDSNYDLIDSDSICDSVASYPTPEPSDLKDMNALSSIRLGFSSHCLVGSATESEPLSQMESASDVESQISASASQKRKPGRPRKHSPTKHDSETIVAKKPRAGLEFIMRRKIRPKLKAELKVRSGDSEDEVGAPSDSRLSQSDEECDRPDDDHHLKKMSMMLSRAKKVVGDTHAHDRRGQILGRSSLSKKALMRDKQSRKSTFEKNSQMEELFRSLKRYSTIAAPEHDESEDESEFPEGDSSPERNCESLRKQKEKCSKKSPKNKKRFKFSINSTESVKQKKLKLKFCGTKPNPEKDTKDDFNRNENGFCSLQVEDLFPGARLLIVQDGLLYAGSLSPITPPDVYGIHIDGERGTKQHIYCQEDLLSHALKEVKPGSTRFLTEGTRVCAFWSQQYRGLYPGCVAAASSPTPEVNPNLVNVEFDDGDSGRIHVDDIRLLPQEFPVIEYDPNPLITLNKRKRRSIEEESEKSVNRGSDCPSLEHKFTPSEGGKSPEVPKVRIKLDSPDGQKAEIKRDPDDKDKVEELQTVQNIESTSPANHSNASLTGSDPPTHHKHKHKRKHKRRRSKDDSDLFPRVEPGDNVLRMRIKSPPPPVVQRSKRNKETALSNTINSWPIIECPKEGMPARRQKRTTSEKSKMAPFLLERHLWKWSGNSYKRQVKGKGKKEFFREIVRGKEHIRVGDCAVFLSSGSHERPFIGKIDFLWQGWGGNMVVKVRWFYHPDETIGIERTLAEPRGALFSSSHTDENDVQTISHKCHVLSLAEYRMKRSELDRKYGEDYDNYDLYYLAGFYDAHYPKITMEPGVS